MNFYNPGRQSKSYDRIASYSHDWYVSDPASPSNLYFLTSKIKLGTSFVSIINGNYICLPQHVLPLIMQWHEHGLTEDRAYAMRTDRFILNYLESADPSQSIYITMHDLKDYFVVFGIGLVLSFVVFLLELAHFYKI